MSFVQVALDESVQESEAVDEGNYELQVAFVDEGESKKGSPMVTLGHEIVGEANAMMVYHYLVMPTEDDEEKTARFKLLNIKRYLTLAGIEFGPEGFNVEDLYGASFNGFVSKEEIEQEDPNAPPAFRNTLSVPRIS